MLLLQTQTEKLHYTPEAAINRGSIVLDTSANAFTNLSHSNALPKAAVSQI